MRADPFFFQSVILSLSKDLCRFRVVVGRVPRRGVRRTGVAASVPEAQPRY
jgi:hypothetical protein